MFRLWGVVAFSVLCSFGCGARAESLAELDLLASPSIYWDVSQAVVAGSGCGSESYAVLGSRNSLSIVGNPIVLSLSDLNDGTTQRKNCQVRIKAVIPSGYYIKEIDVNTPLFATKIGKASAQVIIVPRISNYNSTAHKLNIPKGNNFLQLSGFIDFFESQDDLCNGHANAMMFGANIIVSASRSFGAGEVHVSIGEEGVINLFSTRLASCAW